MRLRHLSIRNVKAISTLDVAFDNRVTLLHGANGIGKSTILDCVALLGHLPCARRLTIHQDRVTLAPPALFDQLLARTHADSHVAERVSAMRDAPPQAVHALREAVKASTSIDRWFEDPYLRWPRVRFDFETTITGAATRLKVAVALVGAEGFTVSHILNRNRCDDLDMADQLVMLSAADPALDQLLVHLADASATLVRDPVGEMLLIKPVAHRTGVGNRVVAINTDLADFGKRDQVRETVKDINLFLAEEVARLDLPFDRRVADQRFRFGFFDELAAILERVITDPAAPRTEQPEPFLTLTSCDIEGGKPHVAFRRAHEQESFSTDFLSAGENECFFVFLTLLGLDTRASIVVLDEPELHIAEYCRPAFFEELYELTKKRGSQVIVATHSLFALTETEPAQFLVVGRSPDVGGALRYTCGENHEYSLSLFKAYWRTGTLFLAVAGAARPFRALALAASASLERLGKERPIPVAILLGAIGSGVFALFNDLLNVTHLQSGQEHIVIIRVVVTFGVLLALASGVLFWAVRRSTRSS